MGKRLANSGRRGLYGLALLCLLIEEALRWCEGHTAGKKRGRGGGGGGGGGGRSKN